MDQPQCVTDFLTDLESRVPGHRLARVRRYVQRLFEQTLNRLEDGTVFVVTGDIPAMWIRDSTWQMLPLLDFQLDAQLQEIIGSVSRRQAQYLAIDPYANAFNESASGGCWHKDFEDQSDWVFERKFELDSWSTFFELALSLYERTGYQTHLDDHFWEVSQSILNLCMVEQNHIAKSYRFQRENAPEHDYLSHDGYGAPVDYTGLVWSAFRPSDDRCVYGYHIPANAHLAATLKRLGKVAREHDQAAVAELADSLSLTVSDAIRHQVAAHGRYPYEVDGLGNALFMDDPNIPSLLSLPELGWCSKVQPEFLATRDWILSKEHNYYFEANGFAGLMSDHTPAGNIWPLSIAMRGLSSSTREEQITCIEMLEAGDGGTGDMHESFDYADPSSFTRPWFSWADMTYVQLVLRAHL
mgnify:CR=1 FL=1